MRSRSRRSLPEACALAGIAYDPHELDEAALGRLFLDLLVLGIDHTWTFTRGWRDAIMRGAPQEPSVPPSRRQ